MTQKQFPAYFEKNDFVGSSFHSMNDCPVARCAIRNIETFTTYKVEYLTVGIYRGSFYSPDFKNTIYFVFTAFTALKHDVYRFYYKLNLHKVFGRLHVTITI